jgi:predicted nucleotidyltransferase
MLLPPGETICYNKNMEIEDRGQERMIAILTGILAAVPDIRLALLYGSLNKGVFGPMSDIDLAVAADKPLEMEKLAELSGELEARLGRSIDILDLHGAEGLILSEAMGGRVLIEDVELRHRYAMKAIYYHEDFRPIVNRARLAAAKKFASIE